jgi:hypothetical protein
LRTSRQTQTLQYESQYQAGQLHLAAFAIGITAYDKNGQFAGRSYPDNAIESIDFQAISIDVRVIGIKDMLTGADHY